MVAELVYPRPGVGVRSYFVLTSLINTFPYYAGGAEMDHAPPDSVGYSFDLTAFSFPNTVVFRYDAHAHIGGGGIALVEVGGGYGSNFDYDLSVGLGATLGAESRFGIDVAGAKSVHFANNSGAVFEFGEAAFNAPGLSSLSVNNSGYFRVDANPLYPTTSAFKIGGGDLVNNGQVIVVGPTSYGIQVIASDHLAPVSINNTAEISVDDQDATVAHSYGIVVDWSATVTNSGEITADNAITFNGVSADTTAHINLANSGTISGLVSLAPGSDTLVNTGTINGDVRLGGGDDSYDGRLGGVQGQVLGGDGADTLLGGVGADTLDGGAGNDSISGGQGDDAILGGDGRNYLRGDDGNDSILGGSAFDDINGNKGNDNIDGGTGGGDWLVGGQGDDLITAHASQNILYGNLGNDTLNAGSGGDLMRGGQGNDSLAGGAGNDWLSGDRGDDTISGGAGADTFHTFSGAGVDRVLDFHIAEGDKVQVDAGTIYTVNQVGADTVIDMGGGDQMILVGVDKATLTPGWIFTV